MAAAAAAPTDEEIAKLEKKVQKARTTLSTFDDPIICKHFWKDIDVAQLTKQEQEEGARRRARLKPNQLQLQAEGFVPGNVGERATAILSAKAALGRLIEELEFAKEDRRVRDVVNSREEAIQFDNTADDCPICLEPLHAGHMDRRDTCVFPCCGKQACKPCFVENTTRTMTECYLCRHSYPLTKAEAFAMREKHTQDGKPYFQYLTGQEYFDGSKAGGITKANDAKALHWLQLAAEQGESEALALLGFLHKSGVRNIVKKDLAKSRRLFEQAASKGHLMAHVNVATLYLLAQGGEKRIEDSFRMITFAAHHDLVTAQCILAGAYLNGNAEGIPKSLERAKYWFGKVVHHSTPELAREQSLGSYAEYGKVLLILLQQNMDGTVDQTSRTPAPEAMYWFRKAREVSALQPQHIQMMQGLEELGKAQCLGCRIRTQNDCKLKPCARCHWAHYCGKGCQSSSWELGHKGDCRKKY